jgi:two-component system phosphate regulon sensor histidine kinase PhoR
VLFLYIIVVSIALVIIFLSFFEMIEHEVLAEETQTLARYAMLIEERILGLFSEQRIDEGRALVASNARMLDLRITYIDRSGTVLADSEEDPSFMENHLDRPEIKSAMEGKNSSVVRYSKTLKKNMLYYAFGLAPGGRPIGVLRLSKFSAVTEALVSGFLEKYAAGMSFIIALSIAGFLVIHFGFRKEIRKFADISRMVSEGNLDVVFSKDDSYEIGELSRSFRLMIAKINALITELVFEKEEIESIISQIEEGIAVIGGDGRIVRVNKSFSRIFASSQPEGKYYWEVIRANEIVGRLRSIGESENSVVELELGGKTFLCSIDNLHARKEFVLLFYDMTALKKIETMKKDLVTNVSHELRTPLTLIKGYVETLIDNETNEDKTKYLGIVLKNTERLDNIIKDLLTLSELESGKTNESFERVDLKTVIECVLPLFNEKLGEKGLDIQYDSPREQCVIAGDSFRLEQVVINLLDNAYKYTNAGKIAIAIERQDNSILLSVRDTGIGIPEKDLDRIFERFYVVNKSRSRTYGGTGLGLSIVKHIVVMHSGTIEVKSSPGLGSTFVLTFPAYKEQLT